MYSFREAIGNSHIINHLLAAVKNNHINHAYIFNGTEGVGSDFAASCFAKMLLCSNPKDNSCSCSSCTAFETGNNPDVIYVKSAKATLSVDDIREQIGQNVSLRPFLYKHKIFIIEKADSMTPQAQNAILKTLEEPPVYAVFLLLSQNYNKFLSTILSRCVLLKFKPLTISETEAYLVRKGIADSKKARFCALYSRGSPGKADELAQSDDFLDFRNEIINELVKLETCDLTGIYKLIQTFDNFRDKIQSILDIIYLFYRDALMLKSKDLNKYVIQTDLTDKLKLIADGIGISTLIARLDAVINAKIQLQSNANFQLCMENLLFKIKEK